MSKKCDWVGIRDEEIAFLNVDVDVRSRARLEALVAPLGERASVHYVGRYKNTYWAHFAAGMPKTADDGVRAIVTMIERLPAGPRRLWDRAVSRVFDIGVQGGVTPTRGEYLLSESSVADIMRVRGSLEMTVYAAKPPATSRSKGSRPTRC